MKQKLLSLSPVLLLLPIMTVFAQQDGDFDHISGKSMGAYFSQQLDETSREAFLKGFIEGFEKSELSQQELEAISKTKGKWLLSDNIESKFKMSYEMGFLSMKKSNQEANPIDTFVFLQGLIDTAHVPAPSYMKVAEIEQSLRAYQKEHLKKTKKAIYAKYHENKKKAKAFMDSNAKQKMVVTSKTGLQYKVIKEGKGPKPKLQDRVKLKVIGKKLDGEIFYDSDKAKGKPVELTISSTIEAWQEALPQMSAGSTWELYVPEKLAYGIVGLKDQIEPGETVIYQIELIEILK